jgi:hypothetical protein
MKSSPDYRPNECQAPINQSRLAITLPGDDTMAPDPDFDHGDEAPLNDSDEGEANLDTDEVLPDEPEIIVDDGVNGVD